MTNRVAPCPCIDCLPPARPWRRAARYAVVFILPLYVGAGVLWAVFPHGAWRL